ncbi:MAG: discoidin domain-containing protein, partial [Magnetococcales bacterium]|nr:discoidin domain-containing protein [Magnetococcales bacterium]
MGHRYWRLYVTASTATSDMLLSMYEIEMRATTGGADQCNGGTASASHANADAAKLFDNNTSNYWVNGSPALGVVCWICYDFGIGSAVSVNELAILPRYGNQCPKDFKLQWSDDNAAWTDRATWTGVTAWTDGVTKIFTMPPEGLTRVVSQRGLPYGIALAAGLRADYELGIMRQKGAVWSYAILLERAGEQPFGTIVEAGATRAYSDILEAISLQPCALLLELAQGREWRNLLERASRQPMLDRCEAGLTCVWSLAVPVVAGLTRYFDLTRPLHAGHRQAMDLLERNPLAARLVRRWDLPVTTGLLVAPWPLVTLNGVPVALEEATLSQGPDDPHWSARLVLGHDADFIGLVPEGELELSWGGERHALLVAHKGVARGPAGPPRRVVTGIGV